MKIILYSIVFLLLLGCTKVSKKETKQPPSFDYAKSFSAIKDGDHTTSLFYVLGTDTFWIEGSKLRINNKLLESTPDAFLISSAYFYSDNHSFFLFLEQQGGGEKANYWVQKINRKKMSRDWITQIPGKYLARPSIRKENAYLSSCGFIGKLNLESGEYDWDFLNHQDFDTYELYCFDTISFQDHYVVFHYKNKKDSSIVDDRLGHLVELKQEVDNQ